MNRIARPAGTDLPIMRLRPGMARPTSWVGELGAAVARWWAKGPPTEQPG